MASARGGAWRPKLLYATLALFLQPCVGPCEEWYAIDIGSKSELKRAPFVINASDLKWSVSKYKPRDLVTGEKLSADKGDKRLVIRGKGDGDPNFITFGGVTGRGPFSLGATIALDETQGLRDGAGVPLGGSTAWAYARYDLGGSFVEYQINLQYQAALDDGEGTAPGFVARAFQDATLLDSVEFPGYASLDVRLVQFDDRLDFLARGTPAAPYGEPETDELTLIESLAVTPVDAFEVGIGAANIDKKGEIYVDMLWFLGPELGPEPGTPEVLVFDSFSTIGACLEIAKETLAAPTVSLLDVQAAKADVDDALGLAISTMFTIQNDIQDGDFDPQTAAKTALKIGKQTYKKLQKVSQKLGKMLQKEQVNTKQLGGICKCLEQLLSSSRVGRANMLGVNVKKESQLGTPSLIPASALPAIF